jgi:NAD(P)-dependent dehydrogenase (short-subunit alcohol dehydrogenase family)
MAGRMGSLEGQTALITGASRGIGRAIAVAFAEAGAAVALVARTAEGTPSRLPGTLEETAHAVKAAGGRALVLPADVRREDQVQAAVSRALDTFERIDLLVNNAAVFHGAPFHEVPLARWDLVLDVNLRGAVVCSQAVIPAMIAAGGGRIINVSSSVAVDLHPGMSPYAASKAGLETLTRYMAAELAPHGIAANVLRIDSVVATEGAIMLNPNADPTDWPSSADAARSALWLACRPASHTGQVAVMSEVLAGS